MVLYKICFRIVSFILVLLIQSLIISNCLKNVRCSYMVVINQFYLLVIFIKNLISVAVVKNKINHPYNKKQNYGLADKDKPLPHRRIKMFN